MKWVELKEQEEENVVQNASLLIAVKREEVNKEDYCLNFAYC